MPKPTLLRQRRTHIEDDSPTRRIAEKIAADWQGFTLTEPDYLKLALDRCERALRVEPRNVLIQEAVDFLKAAQRLPIT